MMKRMLAAALVMIGMSAFPLAQAAQPKVIGEWELTTLSPVGESTNTVEFKLDGETFKAIAKSAQGGEVLQSGHAYVAPGNHHLVVERFGLQLKTALRDGPPVHYQRPAVDVLFQSATRLKGVPMVAVVLTGMGADGADGLLALRKAGAQTIAEDEQSCVVFGMPKEAIARGGAMHVATLLQMPHKIAECLERSATATTRPVAS